MHHHFTSTFCITSNYLVSILGWPFLDRSFYIQKLNTKFKGWDWSLWETNQVVPLLFILFKGSWPRCASSDSCQWTPGGSKAFACVWDEGHLFEFNNGMVFQVADAWNWVSSISMTGPALAWWLFPPSAAKSKRRAIRFLLWSGCDPERRSYTN